MGAFQGVVFSAVGFQPAAKGLRACFLCVVTNSTG